MKPLITEEERRRAFVNTRKPDIIAKQKLTVRYHSVKNNPPTARAAGGFHYFLTF